MSTERNFAIVVDDKRRPREWGVEVLKRLGFSSEKIAISYYGDHAYRLYRDLREGGKLVDIILSDHHMDVTRKPPQDYVARFRGSAILSGVELAKVILKDNPQQKFCLISAGIDPTVMAEADAAGIALALYKRRPEDKKFLEYVEAIKAYLEGETDLIARANALLPAFYEKSWSSGSGLNSGRRPELE